MIFLLLLVSRISFAGCDALSVSPGKSYSFNCNGDIINHSCGLIKGICELELNEKLKKYNFKLQNEQIGSINSFNRHNADVIKCVNHEDSIQCQQENNCKRTTQKTNILLTLSEEMNSFQAAKTDCSGVLSPISAEKVNFFSQLHCSQELEKEGIQKLKSKINTSCPQIQLGDENEIDCRVSNLIKTLKNNTSTENISNLFQIKSCNQKEDFLTKDELNNMNAGFSNFLIGYFSKEMRDCSQMNLDQKSIEQLICFKAEEFKLEKFKFRFSDVNLCIKGVVILSEESRSRAAARGVTPDTRNITGQPEKVDFTLPTEVPAIRNQETLQKIDKLIADNGGEVTPEIAKQAGAIFNSGIYQPTKNFINSVEKAISDRAGSSSSSGSSSPRYRGNKNDKAYEIGTKTSGARTVANITEEAPSAARATAINGKISAAPGSSASAENDVGNRQSNNKEFATSNKQNDKLSSNNFSAGSSSAGGPQGSASVGGSAPNLASASSGARGEELPQLPSLSAADKSEITKVVQALKGAESSEDVKSIVTGEDNYAQVKRIIQELEQSKKGTTQNQEINNVRNPASAQSGEVKDFEKTLEKFGIKVYGEAGPGKAVYAPQTVNHVIVLKNNSVQFLNTIRSKK